MGSTLPPDLQEFVDLVAAATPPVPLWAQVRDAARIRARHLVTGCGTFIQPLNRIDDNDIVRDGFICSVCGKRRFDA